MARDLEYRYWGKAGQEGDDDSHLLIYHCLDVAACGLMLLHLIPPWRRLLEKCKKVGKTYAWRMYSCTGESY